MAEKREINNRNSDQNHGGGSGFLLGAVIGGAISYVVATSDRAQQFIRNIAQGAKDTIEQGKSGASNMRDKVEEKVEEAKDRLDETVERDVKPRIEGAKQTLQGKAEDARDRAKDVKSQAKSQANRVANKAAQKTK